MSSALISAEITATCNALGDANKSSKYILGPHCKESAKDLIKYLRRDDETNSIRRQLGDTNIVHTDLIPIIVHFNENEELFDVILRLLVNLTTPAMILYHEEMPADKVDRQLYHRIISHLQKYKIAFANEAFWKILRAKLTSILNIPHAERTEEKSLVAERIIILIRNVLQIPTDPESERCTHDNPNSHDTVVYVLNQAGMLDILIYIAMSPDESHYYLHLLEIMMLMLKEQNPESLARADRTRTATEKQKDEDELTRIRDREVKAKADRLMKYSSRHSRFGGTYVVKGVKGIGENDVLVHKPITNPEEITFDNENKRPLRKFARGSQMRSAGGQFEHRSPLSVRIILRGFCEEFRGAYNNVMRAVRETIARERAQANDETYYFWALSFFMAFNRHSSPFHVHLISETMAVNIFHFLQVQIDTWLANMTTEKKKIPLWSRRVHVALKAYKEMVMTLLAMVSSKDESVSRSADTIQSNIFYVLEYRELVLVLFHAYQETKFTREFLKDLLETTHVFLKMLEHSCKHRKLVVQKQGRSRQKKKNKKKQSKSSGTSAVQPLTFTDEDWNEMSPQISAIIQHPEISLPTTVPFDGASDLSMDEQQLGAMSTMKSMLKKGQLELAVSLLRSSRELWPENDVFGSMFCPPEEELLILREIYLTSVLQPKDMDETPETRNEENQSEQDDESEEDEEEEALGSSFTEHSFEFIDFMKKFLHPNVTKALSHLLEQYDTNSDFTNHCLVKMMHRIAVDCKMPAMLYQASVFRVFQKLLAKEEPRLKELSTLAKYIVRKFVSTAAQNRHIFMELLFWKSTKDAWEIEEGYDAGPRGGQGAMKGVWQEHEEEELKRLFMEHEINGEAQEKVDWILDNLICKERTRKSVIKKLKDLYLITSTKDLRPSLRPPTNWTEEEEDQLRTFYYEVKDFHDPMTSLRDRMQHRRSKSSILNKLLELRIIAHKSQMYKKRKRKPSGVSGFDDMGHRSSSSSSSSSESDSESPHRAGGSLTSPTLVSTIRRLLASGHRGTVEWLKESLEETLADVDEDETDVPLVPVMAETQEGMQEEDVIAALNGLGLKSPRENMEVYWRIPGVWNTNALKKRIDLLTKLLNNEDPTEPPPTTSRAMDTSCNTDGNSDIEKENHNSGLSQSSKNSQKNSETQNKKEKKKKSEKDRKKKAQKSKENRDLHRGKSLKSRSTLAADSDSSDFGDLELANRSMSRNIGANGSGSEHEGRNVENRGRTNSNSDSDGNTRKSSQKTRSINSGSNSDSDGRNTKMSSQKTRSINSDSDSDSDGRNTKMSSQKTRSINSDSASDSDGRNTKMSSQKTKRINSDSDSDSDGRNTQMSSQKTRSINSDNDSDSDGRNTKMSSQKTRSDHSNSDSDSDGENTRKSSQKTRSINSGSDTDSDDGNTKKTSQEAKDINLDDKNESDNANKIKEKSKSKKKRVTMSLDSSDTDDEVIVDKSKPMLYDVENGGKDGTEKKNRKVLDPDDSGNENPSLSPSQKKGPRKNRNKRVIDSDSDSKMNFEQMKSVDIDNDTLSSSRNASNGTHKKSYKKKKSTIDSDKSDTESVLSLTKNTSSNDEKTKPKNDKNVLVSHDSENGLSSKSSKEKFRKKRVVLNSNSENESTEQSDRQRTETIDSDLEAVDEKVSKKKSKQSKRKRISSDDEHTTEEMDITISTKLTKKKSVKRKANSKAIDVLDETSTSKRKSGKRKPNVIESDLSDNDSIKVIKNRHGLSALKQISDGMQKKTGVNASDSDGASNTEEPNQPKGSNHVETNRTKSTKNKAPREGMESDIEDETDNTTKLNDSERINISSKDTITLDSGELLDDFQTQLVSDKNDLNDGHLDTSNITKTQLGDKQDSINATTLNQTTETIKSSDNQEREAGKETLNVKELLSGQKAIPEDNTEESENSSLLLNSQTVDKAKRPPEVYSDEEREDLVVSKVKRRRVIAEDDDD